MRAKRRRSSEKLPEGNTSIKSNFGGASAATKHLPVKLNLLIFRKFFKSALIPIFFIEAFLLILYFGINSYVAKEIEQTLLAITKDNAQKILAGEAWKIDQQMKEVSRLARIMQRDHEHFFEELPNCNTANFSARYGVHANGVYHKLKDNGGASLYYSSATHIGASESRKAACSESLDTLLKSIVDSNTIVSQAYLNTSDNMNRLYPFMVDAPTQYGPTLVMKDYNFYYLADEKHDPERDVKWTEAYLDPAGQGWMISAVVPIYHKNVLEGVSGLDVTIDALIKTVLDIKPSWATGAFLIDGGGMIIAMSPEIEKLLDLKELKSHVYDTTISGTVIKPSEYNLNKLKDEGLRHQFVEALKERSNDEMHELIIKDKKYLLHDELIGETGWKLMMLIDKGIIYANIERLNALSNRIGMAAIALMVLFYIVFFFYLLIKSRTLATRIAQPIHQLTKLTSDVGSSKEIEKIDSIGIVEIDALLQNFNKMISELSNRSEQILQSRLQDELRIKENEILKRQATTDILTNLPNRSLGEELAEQAIRLAGRTEGMTAILFLDLDKFKQINDTYGHATGDLLLKAVANRLQLCLRDSDSLSRLSGDEFMIVLSQIINQQAIAAVCEKILKSLSEPFDLDGLQIRTSFSIGISVFPDDGEDIDTLLRQADIALFEAKRKGRNTYQFFDQRMMDSLRRYTRTRDQLQIALANRELEVYFQPQVRLDNRALIGVEALVRWNHPDEGLIMPTDFIQVAEESGLILSIGEFVLIESCKKLESWQKQGLASCNMAVNISPIQFRLEHLQSIILRVFKETRLLPNSLDFELTESVLLDDTDEVKECFDLLHSSNIKLAIDDFGTGYSSLAYLRRFKVDTIKIDKSFVAHLLDNSEAEILVSAIIQLAKGLKLKTLAEGVENQAVADKLAAMGCDYGQGYFYGRPMTAEQFEATWLADSIAPLKA